MVEWQCIQPLTCRSAFGIPAGPTQPLVAPAVLSPLPNLPLFQTLLSTN